MSEPITMHCCKCTGDDVIMKAWVGWDSKQEDWTEVLDILPDTGYCNDCKEEVKLYEQGTFVPTIQL